MERKSTTVKRVSIALLVGLLMTTAGCSSLSGADEGGPTVDDGTGTTAAVESNETTTAESATEDGHSHSHTESNASTEAASVEIDAEYSGEMAVMIAGDRVDLERSLGDDAPVRMHDVDTWATNESVTLANVLSAAGVEAEESSLSYDGESYDESADGTEISYRVGSHEVDPEEYVLESDDEVWVLVVTDDSDVATPGEYIPPEQLHVHGTIDFVVDGQELDFSRERYQQAGHNDHFHFEGGHAEPWHAHSAHVTLAYGLSTLEGINVTDEAVVYNGTRYPYDGENGTATVTVNGEPVDPTEYYLKNGDSVAIEIGSSD
ncbi:hypothetical protein [Halobellus rufus]|uniref:hypothetical protein n=1 Tax=Halobellus rufus TaxID=1448860 RepID=UPI000678D326|nr:hypothetical protein [Halobellus rufus]